jgi:tetratricopeptide (TPR) repeat protein
MKFFLTILAFHLSTVLLAQDDFIFYYNQGIGNYEKENYNDAITDFTKALKHKSQAKNEYKIAGVLMERALCKMHLNNFSNALNDIDEALALKPEYTELYYTRSLIHLYNKQWDDAIEWADKGLARKPESEELMLNKIRANLRKKNYSNVLLLSDSLLQINPKRIEALNAKGNAFDHQKKYTDAITTFTKVIELDPQNFEAFYNRGIAKANSKDFKASLADMERAMSIDTSELWIGYNNIAFFIKFEEKDYAGSLELFDKAIKLNPKFSYAYNNRGFKRSEPGHKQIY